MPTRSRSCTRGQGTTSIVLEQYEGWDEPEKSRSSARSWVTTRRFWGSVRGEVRLQDPGSGPTRSMSSVRVRVYPQGPGAV